MREYPPILTGDALQQIAALRDYLVRQTRDREQEIAVLTVQPVAQVRQSGGGKAVAAGGMDKQTAASLRSLIIKTADVVEHHVEEIVTELKETYVAISEYGEYYEDIETKVQQTARDTVESYHYTEQINDFKTELQGQIRRGVIEDPGTGERVLGIAISQELQFTGNTEEEGGLTYWELSPGQTLGLYTSTGWQFWINGSKRGWFDSTDGMLHVSQILVEDRLQHGADWLVTTAGGYGIRYIGS